MALAALAVLAPAAWPAEPIHVRVDLTDAPRRIVHARLEIPASPGPVTLYYPKWIPGEHAPTGPIVNLVGLVVESNGKPVPWRRDEVEMYTFHVTAPPGTKTLDVSLDYLLSGDEAGAATSPAATAYIAILNWNQALLYPAGAPYDQIEYTASLRLPSGWKAGTALPVAHASGATIDFRPATLERLVDSPVIAGLYFREIPLAPEIVPHHMIDLAADSREALEAPPELIAHWSNLVREGDALFGAHHYREYHFLYSLSDHLHFHGLEHHESSDNGYKERALVDEDQRLRTADLLPHEFAHSWNGKHRRPQDLTTSDYQKPMKTDLLWVYEGLTQYLGWVLAARSGLLTPQQAHDYLATTAAELDNEPGRTWRPLIDTAVAAQVLYGSDRGGSSWRRGVDYYDESLLFWLEADSIIRRESHGARSLDDFCRRFHGGEGGAPVVKTYTFEDVVRTMNDVQPYDWRAFFESRVMQIRTRPPLAGIEGEGFRLAYADSQSALDHAFDHERKRVDFRYSLGLIISNEGEIQDVIPKSPAAKAGLGPGMTLLAVDSHQWAPDVMHDALRSAIKSRKPIRFLAKSGEIYDTYAVDYHGGDRYPKLVRAAGPDLLDVLLAPKAK